MVDPARHMRSPRVYTKEDPKETLLRLYARQKYRLFELPGFSPLVFTAVLAR